MLWGTSLGLWEVFAKAENRVVRECVDCRLMRFGYGLITCQRYPGDPRTDADLYGEALQLAEDAERLGFDSVWTSEHHFADDAYAPSLLPLSAAIAARTTSIEIGTGLLLAPLHQPVRLAEDAAVVDLISHSRLILGLGLGVARLGVRGFRRLIDRSRAADRGRDPRLPGGVGRRPGRGRRRRRRAEARASWRAAHLARRARRSRDAQGRADRRRVDRRGTHRGGAGGAHRLASRRAERIGRSFNDLEIAGYWPTFVWERGDAWEMVRPYQHYQEWKYDDSVEAKGRLGPLPSPPALDAETETAIRAPMICGTPDEVIEQVAALTDLIDPGFHYIARLYYPGMDLQVMRESTRLFAERVAPALRA